MTRTPGAGSYRGRRHATLLRMKAPALPDSMVSLVESAAAAVLTTYRRDGTALTAPVWFRFADGAFEVVIAAGDVKLRHLERDPRCGLVVFETTRPFRGIDVWGEATLTPGDVADARLEIAGRYLGPPDGERFAAARAAKPGVLVRIEAAAMRTWDLSAILPS
jgi:PPOX class probable F420-dependent enzyme